MPRYSLGGGGGGDAAITALNNATANELVTVGSTTTELDAETALTFDGSDMKLLEAVNDGNPSISIGGADAERLVIQAKFDSGAQTLESVEFATAAASGTADRGKMVFDVDGTDILTIDDGGLVIKTGGTVGPVGDEDLLTLTAASNTVAIAGELTIAGSAQLDSSPADATYSGITGQFTAGEDLEDGECVYMKAADGKMWKAVSNTGGTGLISADIMCVAMCAADVSADATGTFLLQGFIRANTNFPTYAIGETLYLPEAETGGKNVPEGAVPDSDGDFVQVVGWAVTADIVYFNPSYAIIEHA